MTMKIALPDSSHVIFCLCFPLLTCPCCTMRRTVRCCRKSYSAYIMTCQIVSSSIMVRCAKQWLSVSHIR